jgi:hypothetical protein
MCRSRRRCCPLTGFPDVDTLLGPEMKSTGEVMGIDRFRAGLCQGAAGGRPALPLGNGFHQCQGRVTRRPCCRWPRQFVDMGFTIMATDGTWSHFLRQRHPAERINKVSRGGPMSADAIKNGQIQLIINTGTGDEPRRDGYHHPPGGPQIQGALRHHRCRALAMCRGSAAAEEKPFSVKYHSGLPPVGIWTIPAPAVSGRKAMTMKPSEPKMNFQESPIDDDDKPREACGLFGAFGHPDAAKLCLFRALCPPAPGPGKRRHRRCREGAIVSHKGMGLVPRRLRRWTSWISWGHSAIGHVRYSTTGSSVLANAQPFVVRHRKRAYAVAHNGNLVNAHHEKRAGGMPGPFSRPPWTARCFLHLFVKQPAPGLRRGPDESRWPG